MEATLRSGSLYIAPRMLENSQELCAEAGFRIETRLFPAEEMPFAEGSFNYVFMSTSTMF